MRACFFLHSCASASVSASAYACENLAFVCASVFLKDAFADCFLLLWTTWSSSDHAGLRNNCIPAVMLSWQCGLVRCYCATKRPSRTARDLNRPCTGLHKQRSSSNHAFASEWSCQTLGWDWEPHAAHTHCETRPSSF